MLRPQPHSFTSHHGTPLRYDAIARHSQGSGRLSPRPPGSHMAESDLSVYDEIYSDFAQSLAEAAATASLSLYQHRALEVSRGIVKGAQARLRGNPRPLIDTHGRPRRWRLSGFPAGFEMNLRGIAPGTTSATRISCSGFNRVHS